MSRMTYMEGVMYKEVDKEVEKEVDEYEIYAVETVEKSQTNATNVTMHPLRQSI